MSNEPTALDTVLACINDGECDDDLSVIIDAVRQRQLRSLRALRPGDIVEFNGETRPKYLQNHTAQVTRVNRTTVTCEMVTGEGRFPAGHVVKVPAALVSRRIEAS